MLTQTVTVEVPAYLYEESQRLATLGFFRDFADVVLAGLRRELREAQELLQWNRRIGKHDSTRFAHRFKKIKPGMAKKRKKQKKNSSPRSAPPASEYGKKSIGPNQIINAETALKWLRL
jgi:Arc/MetJ-type ribon-helix-helix transcriptional regulator